MTNSPIESKSEFARVANVVAAQWLLRRSAKGKPKHVQHAAMTAVLGLKCIARGRATTATYRAVAEKIEIIKRGTAA